MTSKCTAISTNKSSGVYLINALREAILNALIHRDYSSYTEGTPVQLDFFTDPVENQTQREKLEREQARLKAMLEIKKKFGKNAIFRGMNLEEGATARERNGQIGGHKA